MGNAFIERYVKSATQGMLDEKAFRFLKGLNKIAAKQGGENAIENYQLLGKRAVVVLGAALVGVQALGFVISRRSEEQRIERIVRRVLAEER